MFKSKNQPQGLLPSKGCEGCSKGYCGWHGAAFTPEYVEREGNQKYGCNDRVQYGEFVVIPFEEE